MGAALLRLARPLWTDNDGAAFLAVANEVEDWTGFATLAASAHCAPLVLRNLRSLPNGTIPALEVETLAHATKSALMRNLRNEAEIRYLEGELFPSGGSGGVYVKGVTLGHRYYQDASLRIHRDIDILFSDENRLNFMEAAANAGFRFFVAGRELEVSQESDLYALYKFGREVSVVSPRNAVIEVHETIDKSMGIFQTPTLLAVAERQECLGKSLLVLPTNWLYCYLAYHACQHNWSKLVWMMDLIALRQSPKFSIGEIRAIARDADISAVVAASDNAAKIFEHLDFSTVNNNSRRTKQIVGSCLESNKLLAKSSDLSLPDLSRPFWLGDGLVGIKFYIQRLLFLSSPAIDDYRLLPMERKYFWLLFLLRPFVFSFRHMRSFVQKHRRASK